MLRIRALNESGSSSEEEDEDNPKLSLEAQEADAKRLYDKAQRLTIAKDYEQAVETFGEILELPFLNLECESKTLSPVQIQLKLGCLKCLSTLYSCGPTKNLDNAVVILELITDMDPNNVNFWYRLGKVAMEKKDLDLASDAFNRALECSPGHWGSIENLVTISYAAHDIVGCLRFCALGLSKDPDFIKGHVFKGQVFKHHPWVETSLQGNNGEFSSLFRGSAKPYCETSSKQYLQEAQDLMREVSTRKMNEKLDISSAAQLIQCPYTLDSLGWLPLLKIVIKFYYDLEKDKALLKLVDIASILVKMPNAEEILQVSQDSLVNGDGDEQSSVSVIMRSRSSSDDKEEAPDLCNDSSRPPNDSAQMSENEGRTEDDSQSMVPPSGGGSEPEDGSNKKKARRDVKWWQLEGQRRSTRARGTVVASVTKPKAENTFAETLRNAIPDAILNLEESSSLKEQVNWSSSRMPSHISSTYFGSQEERNDTREIICQWTNVNIISVLSDLVRWLSRNPKGHWSLELREGFLELYKLYRRAVPILLHPIMEGVILNEDMEKELFVVLTLAELNFDTGDSASFVSNLFVLDNALDLIGSEEFHLRLQWLKAINYLQEGQKTMDLDFAKIQLEILLDLMTQKSENYVCVRPTEQNPIISLSAVKEKLQFVKKIENISKIEELYQAKEYEDLVDILKFSLCTDPSDFKNRLYLAESYLHLNRLECIETCDILVQNNSKTFTENQLVAVLRLAECIWNSSLKEQMLQQDCKILINMVVKLLTIIDKHESWTDGYLLTEPWCILHAILYHVEKMEPAVFLEEENTPSSILVLQLGHEILRKLEKCCASGGRFLSYSVTVLIEAQGLEDYSGFEETEVCLDQAILCLYGHPSKKFKLKNLKDHGSPGVPMSWTACCQLYDYYRPKELPEFDTKASKSINPETENLFTRILSVMPVESKPESCYQLVKKYIDDGDDCSQLNGAHNIQLRTSDVYYLVADYYLKINQDFSKAIEYYIWDLAISPLRFDSWVAIALSKVAEIVGKINACDAFNLEEVMHEADGVLRCFHKALDLDPSNSKVRIEFGHFLYSLHSVYSRECKCHSDRLTPGVIENIETKAKSYLQEAKECFSPFKTVKSCGEAVDGAATDEEDVWINHYMLGKIAEKLDPTEPQKYLSQYKLASERLHANCSTYPSKINYYTPPDYALESLEVYFRIHASILTYIGRIKELDKDIEDLLIQFISEANASPFVTNKQGRGQDGDAKRKKSNAAVGEEGLSKKDMAAVEAVVKSLVDRVARTLDSDTSGGDSTAGRNNDESAITENQIGVDQPNVKLESIQENQPLTAAEKLRNNNPFYQDFSDHPFGLIISACLKALKECVARCPQYFKAFFKLAKTFVEFKKDYRKAKVYLMGNGASGQDKITGLYGERKPSNFFNGIWRNPTEDIDRPGSFAFYMSKSMQLLLTVLHELRDHQSLAEVGMQLSKVPDSKNTYLYTEDRVQYSQQAFRYCETAARKSIPKNHSRLLDCGLKIYETYTKFQKFNPRENTVASVLSDIYKRYLEAHKEAGVGMAANVQIPDAVRFFQQLLWHTKTTGALPGSTKPTQDVQVKKISSDKQTMEGTVPTGIGNAPLKVAPKKPPTVNKPLTNNATDKSAVPSSSGMLQFSSSMLSPQNIASYQNSQMDRMLVEQLAIYNYSANFITNFLNLQQQQQDFDMVLQPTDSMKKPSSTSNLPKLQPLIESKKVIPQPNLSNTMNTLQNKGSDWTEKSKIPNKVTVSRQSSFNSETGKGVMAPRKTLKPGGGRVESNKGNLQTSGQLEPKPAKQGNSSLQPTKVSLPLPPRLKPNPHLFKKRFSTSTEKPSASTNGTPVSRSMAPSFLSSSPFQTQMTALTSPTLQGKTTPTLKASSTSSTPQPAHSQHQLRLSPEVSPEVVDLTTKSPDKLTSLDAPKKVELDTSTATMQNLTTQYLGPKSSVSITKVPADSAKVKPSLSRNRPSANNSWEAILTPSRVTGQLELSAGRSIFSPAKVITSKVQKTVSASPLLMDGSAISTTVNTPHPQMSKHPNMTLPPPPNLSVFIPPVAPKSTIGNSGPVRPPLKRPLPPLQGNPSAYPLPPKKKHHALLPDVEVITLE